MGGSRGRRVFGGVVVFVLVMAGPVGAIGTGSFVAHPTAPSFGGITQARGVALGDLDADGDLDAVVANTASQAERVWRNDGTGVFTAHPTVASFGAGSSGEVALGDLDADGDLDAVVANVSSAETVWRNDGTGVFTAHPTTPSFGSGASTGIAAGDLDADGDPDIVVVSSDIAAKVWTNVNAVGADITAPACTILRVISGPPKQLQVTVYDTGTGLQAITEIATANATVAVSSFSPGTQEAITVMATKTNQALPASFRFKATDMTGNFRTCA